MRTKQGSKRPNGGYILVLPSFTRLVNANMQCKSRARLERNWVGKGAAGSRPTRSKERLPTNHTIRTILFFQSIEMKVLLSAIRDSLVGVPAEPTSDVRDRGGVHFPNYRAFDPKLPVADRDSDNAVLAALADLDPSGVWPPVADFDNWPECCLPFAELCDS